MKTQTFLSPLLFLAPIYALAQPTEVVPEYIDEADKGVNDPRALTLPDGTETTVGEFRKDTIEHVLRAMSLQFKNSVPLGWKVKFESLDGYGALTLGPSFSKIYPGNKKDDFGLFLPWWVYTRR